MSDRPDQPEQREQERSRGEPGRLRSVRDRSPDARARRKPTPVRDMAAAEAPPPPEEPDVEEVGVTVDDVDWIVRVVGRGGRARTSATPLLQLGFWQAASPDGERERERLVVGRALSDLSTEQLTTALEGSVEPPEPTKRKPRGRAKGRRGHGSESPERGR